jgi:hypothetical protein
MSNNIVYPQRLKEEIIGKGDRSYIRTAYLNAPPPPPITCTPTAVYFSINEPVKPPDVV